MVLGDSYIHGGGIEFENNFSQQLKKMFNKETLGFDKVWVLDVSKSSANNLDNNRIYFQFVEKFKPNIVILGYNYNDIEGELDKEKFFLSDLANFEKTETSSDNSLRFIEKLYELIYNSEVIQYALPIFHKRLNGFGIIIPNSHFDVLMKSYYLDMESWKKSKLLIKEIAESTKDNKIEFIVYQFPEINYLDYPQLFTKASKSIKLFFDSFSSVTYVEGGKAFEKKNAKDYMLSKYDGHPNEKAHYVMAKDVFDLIKKEKLANHNGDIQESNIP